MTGDDFATPQWVPAASATAMILNPLFSIQYQLDADGSSSCLGCFRTMPAIANAEMIW
jgi:hypothetical protein